MPRMEDDAFEALRRNPEAVLIIAQEARRARESEARLVEALEGLVSTIDALGTQRGEKMDKARAALRAARGDDAKGA